MRVLIIEDKHEVAANIGDYLEACGHQPDFAYDGLGGLHLAVTNEYDAIVLDIGLPGLDGLSLCRRLREDARSSTPILMLTARDTLDDKLAGFDVGADDYLVKPFALKELVARLNALAQRGRRSASAVLSIADLELDPMGATLCILRIVWFSWFSATDIAVYAKGGTVREMRASFAGAGRR